MLPHYQNRSLEYDQRIDRQINQRLKKKYANLAPVNYTANNPDAEAVYANLEKTLFLIFALLQEAQTYLFEAPNHENDITEQQSDYTEPSAIDYSDTGSRTSYRVEGDDDYSFNFDSVSSAPDMRRLTAAEQTQQQKVISTLGSFRAVISKIVQTTPSLTSLVKQITPLFSYLSQTQVDTIRQLVNQMVDLFDEIARAVEKDLGETNKEKSILFKSLDIIKSGIFDKNILLLGNLVRSYNPVVVPTSVSSINDTSTGYSLGDGVDNGSYV